MEAELAALAGSGATTLVGLMVSDSWAHVRDRIGRFLARGRGAGGPLAELEVSRRELVAAYEAGDGHVAADVTAEWRSRLRDLLRADPAAAGELRHLLDSLDGRARQPLGVHNVISGGTQHGPVIQSGRVTGLTLHSPGSVPAPGGRSTADGT